MSAPSLLTLPGTGVPACCEDETWKPIPDWPHEASTCGRGRSIDRLGDDGIWRLGALLPPQFDKRPGKGYGYFDLRDGKRRRRIPIAVAVLEAHDKLRPGPDHEACHSNGRTDNHLRWLRWDTKAANLAEMWEVRRSVTDTVRELSQPGVECHNAQVRRGGASSSHLSRRSVTSDVSQGTGSPRPFQSFSLVLTPAQPLAHTLRTLFRSLRNRQAA